MKTASQLRSLTEDTITVDDILELLSLAEHAPHIRKALRESGHQVVAMIPEGREFDFIYQAFAAAGTEPAQYAEMFGTFRALVRRVAVAEIRRAF
jgi:hypothetical protein